jgi:hypothetical protein
LGTAFVLPLVPAFLLIAYLLAFHAGRARASLDSDPTATTLPLVVKLVVDNVATFDRHDNLRLLMVTSDHIIVFAPQFPGSVPIIMRFQKGDIHEFETTR